MNEVTTRHATLSTGKDTPTPSIADPLAPNSAPEDDAIALIAERYSILEKLGQGGMGRVFRAHDKILDRNVAIKLLNAELCDEHFVRRFQQEARAASQLNHPNILRVMDFGLVSSNQPYMVMEWVDGETLDGRLQRTGVMTPAAALEIILQIIEGMRHAHRNGIVHRDLKPSNIILTKTDQGEKALILDFGIAKIANDKADGMLTLEGQIIGSPRCISPEQARGEKLDGRSDIYSLGCVMFELLTGRPPFEGNTAMATIAMHLNDPAPRLSEYIDAELPDGLEQIVCKTLEKNANNRFATMDQLGKKLGEIDLDIEPPSPAVFDILPPKDEKQTGIVVSTKQMCLFGLGALIVTGLLITILSMSNPGETIYDKHLSPPIEDSPFNAASPEMAQKEINRQMMKKKNMDTSDFCLLDNPKATAADLQKLLNKEGNEHAYHLRLFDMAITPEVVDVIEKTDRLIQLRFESTPIEPAEQLRIFSIKRLASLKFVDVPISAASLHALKNLTQLTDFQLYDTSLTNAAIKEITTLKNLESLELNRSGRFSSAALKQLASLKKIKSLHLEYCGVGDADLSWISKMPDLKTLALKGDGPFTANGIRRLTRLSKIEDLWLEKTGLDDSCMLILSEIPTLQTLDVCGNKNITFEGLRHFSGRKHISVSVGDTNLDADKLRIYSNDLGGLTLQTARNSNEGAEAILGK